MKSYLLLLISPLLLTACRGFDGVTITRLSDGKVVGRDSPKGQYRDMVLGIDETQGKLAVIEWGNRKSTIKIFGLRECAFSKHSVPVGRLNGIDGAEYYDFGADEYVLHDSKGLHFFGKTKRRDVSNPLPQRYQASRITPCKDGLLIACGNGVGDYGTWVVYRYLQTDGSIKKIYETSEGVRTFSSDAGGATIVEDVRTDYKSRRLVRIDFDGNVLSKATMPMHTADGIKIANGTLYEVYGDGGCRFVQANVDQGTILREIQFAGVSSDITGFDVKGNTLVVGERTSRETSRGLSATVLDLEAKQVQKRLPDQWAWSGVMLMKFNDEIYCILSN